MVVFLKNVFQGPKGLQIWNNIFKDQQNHKNNLGYFKKYFSGTYRVEEALQSWVIRNSFQGSTVRYGDFLKNKGDIIVNILNIVSKDYQDYRGGRNQFLRTNKAIGPLEVLSSATEDSNALYCPMEDLNSSSVL